MLLLSESSINTARKSVSPRLQSATCLRSLPWYGCTSSFLTARVGASFLPAAVTVTVTALGSGGALRVAMGVKAHAAIPASSRAPWKCIFLFIENSFAQTNLITTYGRRNTAQPEKVAPETNKSRLAGAQELVGMVFGAVHFANSRRKTVIWRCGKSP